MRADILELFAEFQSELEYEVLITLSERSHYRRARGNERKIAWVKRNRKRVSEYERSRRRRIREGKSR